MGRGLDDNDKTQSRWNLNWTDQTRHFTNSHHVFPVWEPEAKSNVNRSSGAIVQSGAEQFHSYVSV